MLVKECWVLPPCVGTRAPTWIVERDPRYLVHELYHEWGFLEMPRESVNWRHAAEKVARPKRRRALLILACDEMRRDFTCLCHFLIHKVISSMNSSHDVQSRFFYSSFALRHDRFFGGFDRNKNESDDTWHDDERIAANFALTKKHKSVRL